MSALASKAERQLRGVQDTVAQLEGPPSDASEGLVSMIGEASAGLATAMLTIRNFEETLARETSMDKRQSGKQ